MLYIALLCSVSVLLYFALLYFALLYFLLLSPVLLHYVLRGKCCSRCLRSSDNHSFILPFFLSLFLSSTVICVNKPYCYASDTRLVSTGYACVNKICELCPSGTFSNDGISCRTCPYATSSIPGSKTCGSTIRFNAFGSFSTYIPYGISKINVRLWGGGGGGDANALQENVSWNGISTSLDPRAGGGGGFSACNITVIQNTFVRVIVGGGGKDSFGFTDFTGGVSCD